MFVSMKPYSLIKRKQMKIVTKYGKSDLEYYIPYTLGVTNKESSFAQKKQILLRPGFHTSIKVVPKLTETSDDFNSLSQRDRKCKMGHEMDHFRLFKNYSRVGCEVECAVESAVSICQCYPWYYPNNFTEIPICDWLGASCFDQVMTNQTYYKQCPENCPIECQGVSNHIFTSHSPLDLYNLCKEDIFGTEFEKDDWSVEILYWNYLLGFTDTLQESTHQICMEYLEKHVAFVTVETVSHEVLKTVKDRKVAFTDQMAMVGGTLGLFTGTSIISLIELVCLVFKSMGKSLAPAKSNK